MWLDGARLPPELLVTIFEDVLTREDGSFAAEKRGEGVSM